MLYGNTPSDSSVDLDRISEAYTRLVESYFPELGQVQGATDWNLRLVWLPDSKLEVIYSVSHRDGQARITLVRFLESAWRRFALACRSGDDKVSVPVEIGELDLPEDHSVHHIVTEGIPRACEDDPTPQHHGEEVQAVLSGPAWNPRGSHVGAVPEGGRGLDYPY